MNSRIEWPIAPAILPTGRDFVHVWAWEFEQHREELDQLALLLSPEENIQACRFHFAKDRLRYTVSHAVLRIILGRYLERPARSLQFLQSKYGKPELASIARATPELRFNLSHTDRMAALAVSADLLVGVDLEELVPIDDQIAWLCFSDGERTTLKHLEGQQWIEGFYNCWTRKEAILKAEGIGLQSALQDFEVSLHPKDSAALLCYRPTAGLTVNWQLLELRPGIGVIGTLATNRAPATVSCFHFGG